MKKYTIILLCCLWLFSSCLKEDAKETIDLAAPEIKANAGQPDIRPEYFFKTNVNTAEIPVDFMVEDATGIREVKIESHSGFDGHTHGKSSAARNPKFKLFSYNEVIGAEGFEDARRFSYSSTIYLDERNPEIESDELILGGPYHLSIQATDLEGNETNYGDDTHYHTTVYINKPYAPQVELTGTPSSNGSFSGRIYRNTDHSAASDITFLWIYIEAPNMDNPSQPGSILKERLWGESNWPHQFRSNQGEALPDVETIDMNDLLGSDTDFLSSLQGNHLVIWAEDTNGNISVNQFNN